MSNTDYTDETYSAAGTEYTETADGNDPTNDNQDNDDQETPDQKGAERVNEPEEKVVEGKIAKAPEPEPEPEPDPLEGITYEDDPSIPLPSYGDASYWESRYAQDPEVFEWYQEPKTLLPHFKEYIDTEGKILIVGNGTSELAPFMAKNGFESVVAIDYVKPPVTKMKKRTRDIENLTWKVMDVKRMSFGNSEFQAIVDKGTLDSVFHLGDADTFQMMAEISRCLKKRGVFMCLSCAAPEFRMKFFNRPADLLLELEKVIEIPKPLQSDEPHYLYIVRKVGKLLT